MKSPFFYGFPMKSPFSHGFPMVLGARLRHFYFNGINESKAVRKIPKPNIRCTPETMVWYGISTYLGLFRRCLINFNNGGGWDHLCEPWIDKYEQTLIDYPAW